MPFGREKVHGIVGIAGDPSMLILDGSTLFGGSLVTVFAPGQFVLVISVVRVGYFTVDNKKANDSTG